MPPAVAASTPPQNASKRQRTQLGDVTNAQDSQISALLPQDDQSQMSGPRMPPYLNKSRSDISHLFQELEWKQRFRINQSITNRTSRWRIDRSQVVLDRNRYGTIQPWDASRIKLKRPIGGSDYVNASPILLRSRARPLKHAASTATNVPSNGQVVTDNETSPVAGEKRYIATQGPKDGQFSHFWHMVMQEIVGDVGVIVMLTQMWEGNKEKCSQYFPETLENPTMTISAHEDAPDDENEPIDGSDEVGDADIFSSTTNNITETNSQPTSAMPQDDDTKPKPGTLTLLSLNYDATTACELRTFRLTLDGQTKTIQHYLFNGWPDFGKPEAEDRAALRHLIRESARVAGDQANPRFIHCSAGVGRTGTFIALDYLLGEIEGGGLHSQTEEERSEEGVTEAVSGGEAHVQQATLGRSGAAKEQTPEADDDEDVVFETVDKLREQRMMMVMNELQFAFIYEVLREAWVERFTKNGKEGVPKGMGVIVSPEATGMGGLKPEKATANEKVGEEGDRASEAETEILEEKGAEAEDGGVNEEMLEKDPYPAVAPESIRQGMERKVQADD